MPASRALAKAGRPIWLRVLAPSVIGRNAFDTELIWQHMYMDPFYSPGREKIHALGGIDMALWDIKAKALNVPLYMLCGGKVREHVQLYATPGLPRDVQSGPTLKERAAATMASGYYAYRVDGSIQPNPGFDGVVRGGGPAVVAARTAAAALQPGAGARPRWRRTRRTDIRLARAHPVDREGCGTDPRRHGTRRQLVHRHSPEVRLPGNRRDLPVDRAVPARTSSRTRCERSSSGRRSRSFDC